MGTTQNIEAALQRAAAYVQATWQQTVMGNTPLQGMRPLNINIGLRRLYADNILVGEQQTSNSGIIQRISAQKNIAKQLENGTGPWDMKPGLLGGPKAKMGKNGRYNIIPFRHGTSNAYSPNNNFPTMPKNVYTQARALKASVKAGTGTKWGGRLAGTEFQHPPGQNTTSGYQHKTGKYEGMARIEKPYQKATQSKYMTFRVVSEKSAPGSWIHPGYKAHDIVKSVATFCRPGVTQMIREAAIADIEVSISRL
ncbi:MAG: hypothetical protein WCK54_18355 [Desulfuromonadales bacterium]